MGLCVPYIHSDSYSLFTARLRQKGAEMRFIEVIGVLLLLAVWCVFVYDLHHLSGVLQ